MKKGKLDSTPAPADPRRTVRASFDVHITIIVDVPAPLDASEEEDRIEDCITSLLDDELRMHEQGHEKWCALATRGPIALHDVGSADVRFVEVELEGA